jgi:YihY family inner membrane protein
MRHIAAFWRKAYQDNLTGLAAMVAYNLLLSLFPLALIALFVAGQVLRSDDLVLSVTADLKEVFPGATETTLNEALHRVRDNATTAGIVALVASLWIGSSFWGALDTAFCRLYHVECRPWVRQKLFGLKMLVFVLVFFAASVTIPAAQALLAAGAKELPFGLSEIPGSLSLAVGLVVLFWVLCVIYRAVPNCSVPWRAVWPGALGATLAMTAVDYIFPLYLRSVSTLADLGPSLVFILIALLWFYALALILLAGGVINAIRLSPKALPTPQPPQDAVPAPPPAPAAPASRRWFPAAACRVGARGMSDHDQYADDAEARLGELERESERLGERVQDARDDWEAKKADPQVPGAGGDPERAEAGPVPEATYPDKRPDDGDTGG